MKKKSLVFWSGLLVACLMLSGGVCLAQGPAEEEGTVSIDPYGYGFEAPTPDVPFSLDGETLPKLAQSLDSYYYLDEEGGLVSWDRDEEGSLGRRVDGSPATPGRMDLPGRVVDLVTDSSMNTNLAVLENGEVYAWGRDYFGILPGNEISLMPEPVRLELPEDLRRIAISPQLLTVLRADGSIEYCGVERGTLLSPEEAMDPTGVVEQSERNALQVIDLPAEAGIRDIKNGMAYRLFLTDSGEVWIDGFLVNDLLYREPTRVNFPEAIVQLGCQDTGYLALGMSGALYFHGLDRSATVGLEIPADGSEPR